MKEEDACSSGPDPVISFPLVQWWKVEKHHRPVGSVGHEELSHSILVTRGELKLGMPFLCSSVLFHIHPVKIKGRMSVK